jgi:hypothetical protein
VANVTDSAVKFALSIANDNSHGYDQAHRDGKPDYDCSSLVIASFEQAGIKVKEAGAHSTRDMKAAFLKCGFTDIVKSVNLKTGEGLQIGDVLLDEGKHTAICAVPGEIVHASINENGEITGGKPGDQTGKEICARKYYNHPWNCVLRYTEKEMSITEAFTIVKTRAGLDDSTMHYLTNDYRFGNQLIIKLAKAMEVK